MKHLRLFPQPRRLIACLASPKIVDDTAIIELAAELMEAAAQARSCGKLILDCRKLEVMSSAVIGKLILLNKQTKTDSVQLHFWNVQPKVMEVFAITRLNKVFHITDESEDRDEDPFRFVPELFEVRNQVLAALEAADFYWWRDYGTVCPVHDLYGIEVCGIRQPQDADQILKLLQHLIPDWKCHKICVGYRCGAELGRSNSSRPRSAIRDLGFRRNAGLILVAAQILRRIRLVHHSRITLDCR